MNFEDYSWHDSVIKSISINRNNPGVIDEISFEIEWYDGDKGVLIFEDAYWASLTLNFGIVADENILHAKVLSDSDPDLVSLYNRWKGLINDIKLTTFLIELNSSGGMIKIIAKRYNVKKMQF